MLKPEFVGRLKNKGKPPSGGCVLKLYGQVYIGGQNDQPPSGGCVLKPFARDNADMRGSSRLQAAVC